MGDHRFSCKIEFEMHGVKRETDMWLNYDHEPVDGMVVEFFEKAFGDAMSKYWDAEHKATDRKNAEKEQAERELLASLKKKYDPLLYKE